MSGTGQHTAPAGTTASTRPAAPPQAVSTAAASTAGQVTSTAAPDAIPKARLDIIPLALLLGLLVIGLPLVGSTSTWVTLSVAGLAMGMIVFIIASGLTLVFGLMDVLNFGHGVFIALGAYIATSLLGAPWSPLLAWMAPGASVGAQVGAVLMALLIAALLTGLVGLVFERVIVRPVYGLHLKQILITMGGMIVGEELIKVIWGPAQLTLQLPEVLRGAWLLPVGSMGAPVEKLRMLAVVIGALVLGALLWALNRTKLGLLVRAGVQDREMVEALGYRVSRLFVGVFAAGSALAGLGGVLWGLYQQNVTPQIGAQVNVLIFIVIIIGGLGSTLGCFVGALLVGLMANYTGFLAPKLALFSNIGLMVAILLWRPRGLYPVTSR